MHRDQQTNSAGVLIAFLVVLLAITLEQGLVSHHKWYRQLYVIVPLLVGLIILRRRGGPGAE